MQIHYQRSTHAPLFERYMGSNEGYVAPGEEKAPYDQIRIDPETGAEYRALGGKNHCYNRDYTVGSSYPKAVFVYASRGGDALTHDELEQALKHHDLWSDALSPVILPKGYEYGEVTWWYAYQFKPVERGPRMDRVADQLEERTGNPNLVWETDFAVEAQLSDSVEPKVA